VECEIRSEYGISTAELTLRRAQAVLMRMNHPPTRLLREIRIIAVGRLGCKRLISQSE